MIFISSSNRQIVSERGKKNLYLSDIIFNNSFLKKNKKKGSNYHWNNNIKLKKDLNYILKTYETLLNILTNNLNKIHKVNFSISEFRRGFYFKLIYFFEIFKFFKN